MAAFAAPSSAELAAAMRTQAAVEALDPHVELQQAFVDAVNLLWATSQQKAGLDPTIPCSDDFADGVLVDVYLSAEMQALMQLDAYASFRDAINGAVAAARQHAKAAAAAASAAEASAGPSPYDGAGALRGTHVPASDGVVWHSTCGYEDCVEPSRYAADSTCKGCRRIKYCTRECQKADWMRHKRECKAAEAADAAAALAGALVVWSPPPPHRLLDAAAEGSVELVKALLALGADVNAALTGGTPLLVASQRGHAGVVGVLLTAPGVAVNASTSDGVTPLFVAALNGHAAVVAALLASPGVDVNASKTNGATPLHIASYGGHTATVDALLAVPGVDVNASMTSGATPLYLASQNGHDAVVFALLCVPDADVNAAKSDGATPLYIAAEKGHVGVVAALLAAPGVDASAAKSNGATPLYIAAHQGHVVVVSALLATPGVVADAASDGGWTPLHAAAFAGHAAVVKVLLAHPAGNINARTTQPPIGATPQRLARDKGHAEVVAMIEARGGRDW